MAYERINWQNGEVGNTPLNANNLNRMDMTLEEHDQKIGDHDYEIENLKTGAQGITEEINKKMDRINPQGSGTFSIPAVNADNITAQTVEADEIKVAKVGSKGGTAPVVFDNDILVSGITTPIGSLASSASSKAESAERIANEADREAGTARTIASTAYSRVQENIFRTDKLEGIVGGGVGESIPQYTYYNGKYLRPDGEIANYNDSARVIEFEINKNSDSGCNVIFKNVDLIPIDASILCGFYNAAGILLAEEMRGLIIMADFDEDTGKMTRQYIDYCVVPAPYYAKYVRISGIANGVVDVAVQSTLSDAINELQNKPEPSGLVLTNPSPLPATDSKPILGIDAKGNSTQNGTPTPTNPIPIKDASGVVEAHTRNLFNLTSATVATIDNGIVNVSWSAAFEAVLKDEVVVDSNKTYTISFKAKGNAIKFRNNGQNVITTNASTDFVSYSAQVSGADKIAFSIARQDTSGSAQVKEIMLEEGTTASEYVEYKSNAISLEGVKWEQGTISSSDGSESDRTDRIRTNFILNDFVLHIVNSTTDKCAFHFYDKSKKYISGTGWQQSDEIKGSDFKPTNAVWTRIIFAHSNESAIAPSYINASTVFFDGLPLNIDLRSIGNIADTLTVNEDGSGEWVQRVMPYSIPSTEASKWQVGNPEYRFYYVISKSELVGIDATNIVLCDKYIGIRMDEIVLGTKGVIVIQDIGSDIRINCYSSLYNNIADFRANFNGIYFYYPLATPIIHTLTKEQVDAIRQLKTYKGTTVIESEMQIESVTYAGDIKAYIDYRINQIINPTALSGLSDIPDEEVTEE